MLLFLYSSIYWIMRARLLLESDWLRCNGNGERNTSGQCICKGNYYGDTCECYFSDTFLLGPRNKSAAIAECTPDFQDALVCSGQGDCHCGNCRCFPTNSMPSERFSGLYCECDDYACPYLNGKMCGDNGRCVCGKCTCLPGFTGETCDCSTSTDTCRSSNGQICNGKGVCVCGTCECDPGSPYNGPTCEDCFPIVEISSVRCNNHGSLDSCDQCICEDGYFNDVCECQENFKDPCIRPNSTKVCSGRGECICGKCSCSSRRANSVEKFSGRYCQCDDFSCSYYNNKRCGGHGDCVCGECFCEEGFSGEACDCPASLQTCLTDDGLICNGHGKCQCGVCDCDPESNYKGPTCEECPTCQAKCLKYKECIRYALFETEKHSTRACSSINVVDELDLEGVKYDPNNMFLCRYMDVEASLYYIFTYRYYNHNAVKLTAQSLNVKEEKQGLNVCIKARTCTECFDFSEGYSTTCGWYKHLELPALINYRCDLYDNFLNVLIPPDAILTSKTAPNVTIIETASAKCSGHGSLDSCGQCQCDSDVYGYKCDCNVLEVTSDSPCLQSPISLFCSGQGQCICGTCYCYTLAPDSERRYSGQYCECNDFSCPLHEGAMCGGHGKCNCGVCTCDDEFSGESCECPLSQDTCLADSGEVCNGYGNCMCGVCTCDQGSYMHGPTCEGCPTCPGQCFKNRECVQCTVFGTGEYSSTECKETCPRIKIVETLDIDKIKGDANSFLCAYIDEYDDLQFIFSYSYDKNNVRLTAQWTKMKRGELELK